MSESYAKGCLLVELVFLLGGLRVLLNSEKMYMNTGSGIILERPVT